MEILKKNHIFIQDVVATIIFCSLLWAVGFSWWFELPFFIFIYDKSKENLQKFVAAICTIYFWMFYETIFSINSDQSSIFYQLLNKKIIAWEQIFFLKILSLALFFVLYLFVFRRFLFSKLKLYPKYQIFLGFVITLVCATSYCLEPGYWTALIWSFTTLVVASTWYLTYEIFDYHAGYKSAVGNFFFSNYAFWNFSVTPLLSGAELAHGRTVVPFYRLQLRKYGLKILSIYVLAFFFVRAIGSLLWGFGPYEFPGKYLEPWSLHLKWLYTVDLSHQNLSRWEALASVFYWVADIILFRYGLILAVSVCALAFLGYSLPSPQLNFMQASNFNDFFRRILYYYNRLIIRFFYLPFFFRLRKIKSLKIRIFVADFLGVFVFGLIYHFLRDFHLLLFHPLGETFKNYWTGAGLYFCLIALTSATATLFFRAWLYRKPWVLFIRSLAYFGLFSFVRHFNYTPFSGDLGLKWMQFLKLFY